MIDFLFLYVWMYLILLINCNLKSNAFVFKYFNNYFIAASSITNKITNPQFEMNKNIEQSDYDNIIITKIRKQNYPDTTPEFERIVREENTEKPSYQMTFEIKF